MVNIILTNICVCLLITRLDINKKPRLCPYIIVIDLYIQTLSEYDQEIPQSHTAEQPTAPRGSAIDDYSDKTSGRRQFKQSNQPGSFPRQDDYKTRKDIKECITKQSQTQNTHRQWEEHKTIYQQQRNHDLRTDSNFSHWVA